MIIASIQNQEILNISEKNLLIMVHWTEQFIDFKKVTEHISMELIPYAFLNKNLRNFNLKKVQV